MIGPLNRLIVQALKRFNDPMVQRLNGPALLVCALFWPVFAGGQPSPPAVNSVQSASGQFVVTGPAQFSSPVRPPGLAMNTNLVRLEPALLSVSAERIKESLRRKLGIDPNAPWQGKIFLVLHPAQLPDEDVTIVSQPFLNGWNYRVQLPDVLPPSRFLRAMTSVLLLELANRNATGARAAEIPGWLTDGLAQQLPAAGSPEIILSAPGRLVDGLPQSRTVITQRGVDPLAGARRVLRDHAALTFDQLSWPADAQLTGEDGGVYLASAQLFVSELLGLQNGPAHLRTMLAALPGCYNWQTAFQSAFREYFPRPLDVEKWWALQVVSFVAHGPGPRWTPAVSREELDEILSVPVEVWTASNTLPAHAEISLQAVIRNFEPPRQVAILESKLRDLELAQLRVAAPLAALTDEYRRTVANYLGQNREIRQPLWSKHPLPPKTGARATLKKLDALDTQRQTIESSIKPDVFTP
ncbi:MAG: hypothetical protein ABSA45_00105 [Verrucomicrobiota bacterium]|jgi:hypothetical protein